LSDDNRDGQTGSAPPDVPDFVAVTPRGVVPEPPAAHVAGPPEEEAAPDTVQPAAADAGTVAATETTSETAPEEPAPIEPEPTASTPIGSAAADAAEDTSAAMPAVAEPGGAAPIEPEAVPPAPPAAREAAATPEAPAAGPAEPTPGAEPADDPNAEVSVRIAAEGMANALAGAAAPATDAEWAPAQRRVRAPGGALVSVCVVLAIAAATLLAISAQSLSHHRAVAAARVAALEAATREAAPLFSYDYRTFDRDVARAEAGLSTKFRANYAETMATQVRGLALKNHAVTQATVVAGGVVSATPSRAKILIFADQQVQNTLLSVTSRLDQSQFVLSMVKQNGHWLIDHVEPF
jgi:hypothetical protein